MSSKIRCLLQNKIFKNVGIPELAVTSNLSLKFDKINGTFTYDLPVKSKNYDIRKEADVIVNNKYNDINILNNAIIYERKNHKLLSFNVNRDNFVKEILEGNSSVVSPPIIGDNKNIIIEFSSPNIAKPFHVGHLRSTMIGNCIANINMYLKNNVTRINYLGDWGTQLGFILLGMKLTNTTQDDIKIDPIKKLYSAYVMANKLAETDSSVLENAKNIFHNLENGDVDGLKNWELIKKYTIDEFEKTYQRIGIKFDEYNWESSYNFSKVQDIIAIMEKLNILKIDNEGRKVISINDKKNSTIIKSDGSTLYITRDIAAAIDRHNKYNFDEMYYVVGNEQFEHFNNLSMILEKMKLNISHKIHHVKFGKIKGMSSRKGTAIFLSDILDEAKAEMKDQQNKTSTTKILANLDDDNSSDILGISAVIVHDLKQRRTKDYEFNWNVALDSQGESGVRLQYAHCRLTNLEKNCGANLPSQCDPTLLQEPIVNELVALIGQFDEAVISAHQQLEPCHLVKYLFHLSHSINRTMTELRVKDEPSDVASQRLLLYHSAKNVLNTGMKLIGLTPLEKM